MLIRLGGMPPVWKLRLTADADAVFAKMKAHLHLWRFKPAKFFRNVGVAVAKHFTQHHAISGGFCRSDSGMWARNKRGFRYKAHTTENHLRHGEVTDGLHERFSSSFEQLAKLRRQLRAGGVHLFVPMLRANHAGRDGGAALTTGAIGEQRGQLIGFAIVPIDDGILHAANSRKPNEPVGNRMCWVYASASRNGTRCRR